MMEELVTWKALSIEVERLRAENAKLRAALESLRETGHREYWEDDKLCPKHPKYCGPEDRTICNCGTDRTNAIIDAALKGDG